MMNVGYPPGDTDKMVTPVQWPGMADTDNVSRDPTQTQHEESWRTWMFMMHFDIVSNDLKDGQQHCV